MTAVTLDLAVVNPPGRTRIYQSLGSTLAAIENPVWAGLIAEAARARGRSVAIVDANALDLTPEETAARVKELAPRLTAVVVYGHQPSASTQVMPGASAVTAALKDLDSSLPVILVGGHVAALPERTLREEKADYVAIGEGLATIDALLSALEAGSSDLSKVPGLGYRLDGGIVLNPDDALVKDVARSMPGFAWDLLPMDRYRAHNWHCFGEPSRMPYASIYTTLGCPYHCSFCCIQAPFRAAEGAAGLKEGLNSYRFFSPAFVVDQLTHLVERYGVKNVKVADEMFVLNRGHVEAICDGILARGLDLNIWAYARVDTVRDDRLLEKLRRAGFRWLAFGIEAASERVRGEVQKGFKQSDIYDSLKRVRAQGIYVIANYIFGLPEDDVATMQETLDMSLELNCEMANFYVTMAYPGSPLYQQALAEGWALPESWSGYSQHSVDTLPLPTKHISASEVLRFRDDAFNRHFADPRYFEMLEKTFGEKAVAEVRAMTAVSITRRFA